MTCKIKLCPPPNSHNVRSVNKFFFFLKKAKCMLKYPAVLSEAVSQKKKKKNSRRSDTQKGGAQHNNQ